MDQNADSNNPTPVTPTAPVSDTQSSSTPVVPDDSTTNPAAAFAPPVSPIEAARNATEAATEAANDEATAPSDTTPTSEPTPAPSDTVVAPEQTNVESSSDAPQDQDTTTEVVKKIAESQNVLVALSSDPSVDEMCAAIGLSLFLDKLGKRATAIYSGATPNALEFLKPEETFESTADTLQDFVIALNKEKADHLRYKLDGDYVKIYITPYKTRIGEEDLEFSYGDFNVDLVLALDVANGVDLDSALREHGRIMHDAVVVNITTGNPGKFGEIEWSDKDASSISEMVAKMLYSVSGDVKIEKDEATAFLTGIIAATNRFSKANTTPNTMEIASRLMQSGANQQLISENITPDVDNELYSLSNLKDATKDNDPTKLDIEHNEKDESKEDSSEDSSEENVDKKETTETPNEEVDPPFFKDLKEVEKDLSQNSDENKTTEPEDYSSDTPDKEEPAFSMPEDLPSISAPEKPSDDVSSDATPNEALPPVSINEEPKDTQFYSQSLEQDEDSGIKKPEKVIQPLPDLGLSDEGSEKYGEMLKNAISDSTPTNSENPAPAINDNPASTTAPSVSSAPEINGVPEMNFMPMPGEEVLPPPPTPPINTDFSTSTLTETQPITPDSPQPIAEPIAPSMPTPNPTPEVPSQSDSQPSPAESNLTSQPSEASAFKIPGM